VKIVIFGLTLSSSWGNGHATLWRGLCRALIRDRHTVVFFERDTPYYAEHRDLSELPGGRLVLYSDWEDAEPAMRRHLADADVGIVTSYCPDALAAGGLLEHFSALRVFYDLDTPVTLDCLKSGKPVSYLGPEGLVNYELVLSYTGGRALDELQSRLGAREVAPLYGSVDPEAHHPVVAHAAFLADLSYLGTYAEDRQAILETLFVEPARRLPHRHFIIGGAQYPHEFPWTKNIFFVRHVEPALHPLFFCSSRITLNVTRRAMREMGYCPSGRLFEAAACGTPILSDDWEGLDHFFEPGSEIIVGASSDDTIAALQMTEAELYRMAQWARERVLAEHTATHRARELERLLERARSSPAHVADAPAHADTFQPGRD
jgi:spore maturation protein CgeB